MPTQKEGLRLLRIVIMGLVLISAFSSLLGAAQENSEALVLLRQLRIANATNLCGTSSSISSRKVQVLRAYGTMALQCGAFDQALNYLEEALLRCINSQRNGGCALERTLLGHAYAESGSMDDALEQWRNAPGAVFYLLGHSASKLTSGNAQVAERFARWAVSLDPHTSWKTANFDWVNAYSALGNALAAQGRWEEAFSAYQSGLADSVTPTPYLAAADIAQIRLKKPEVALPILEMAQQRWPDHKWVNLKLGDLYRRMGNLNRATQIMDPVYREYPSDSWVALYIGMLRYDQGQFQETARLMKEVLSQDANHVTALVFLGLSQQRLGYRTEALQNLYRAATLAPDNSWAQQALASVLAEMSD